MKLGRSIVGVAALVATGAVPTAAQIFPRGQVPIPSGGTQLRISSVSQPTYALPGCGEGIPTEPVDGPSPPERKKIITSPGGVDMRSGSMAYQNVDVAIGGEGDAGLTLTRSFSYKNDSSKFRQPFGYFFTHNWDIQLQERRLPRAGACYVNQWDYSESVIYGDLGDNFRKTSGSTIFSQTAPYGYAELSFTGAANSPNAFVFTARDGTVVNFMHISRYVCPGVFERCGYATSIKRPDGTLYTLEYETLADGVGKRLRSVVSSRGYALLLEYASEASGFQQTNKICALNLAVMRKPLNNICPVNVATATYRFDGPVQTSAAEASGGKWTFARPTPSSFSLTKPGASYPYVTNSYSFVQGVNDDEPAFVIDNQQLASGQTYKYLWSILVNQDSQGGDYQQVLGGSWKDSHGRSISVSFGSYYREVPQNAAFPTFHGTPGPEVVVDELGRVTRFNCCGAVANGGQCYIPPLRKVTYPEGDTETLSYTAYRDLHQVVKTAKPGSGLADITETRNYPNFAATSAVARAKPTSLVDGRGNVTTFTYDQVHGGILTETLPGGLDGVRAVKRYAYVQRYAWLANGSGGFVKGATPLWLLSEERTCRTTATFGNGCAGGAGDEVVTAYDYGPDTGTLGNNLLLRGVVVSANGVSRRTCYGYDPQGNRIWEAKPRAGLVACS